MSGIPDDIMVAANRAAGSCLSGTSIRSKQGILAIAKAINDERQRHSSVRRSSKDAEAIRQMIADGKVFADTDPEARFIADADLSCPHCGGSGHKDDVRDQWQDISTAPRDGTHVLLYVRIDEPREKDVGIDVGFYVTHRTDDFWAWSYVARPTHWMPLPAAPKGEA